MTNWERIKDFLRLNTDELTYNTWFSPLSFIGRDENTIYIKVPNIEFKNALVKHFLTSIREAVFEILKENLNLKFLYEEELPIKKPGGSQEISFNHRTNLNPKYTFESFVVGPCNQFAHAASTAVAENPGKAYNPLYIYGGVGLGKTHLMSAIGHHILKKNSRTKLFYVTTENFMNELINYLHYGKIIEFRKKYRSVDVLLIDDIQFLSGKDRTKEEFFHTFNYLYDAQKQVVISSDCPPKEIPHLEERLHSRFEWGLIADLKPPELEMKVAILQKKAGEESVTLPENVALFIASKIQSNIRELEGCLKRIIAFSSLKGVEIDLLLAKEALKNLIDVSEKKITSEAIQKFVAEKFNIKIVDLKSKNNSPKVSFPRQIAMYLIKELTEYSLPEIGRSFGDKHHTTVLYSIKKIEGYRKRDQEFNRLIASFVDYFRQ
ncbi:MAG: chromosomal replication initiator protein DnaA [Acidobacteriota bacterium]